MKTCTICKTEKSLSEFHKCVSRPDGHDWRCRSCKKSSDDKYRRKLIDARRYEKSKGKAKAREVARLHFPEFKKEYKCSVLNCPKMSEELHHVTYEDPLAVVPLCSDHHRMDHEIVKLGS